MSCDFTSLQSQLESPPLWQVKIGNRGDSKINAPVAVSDGLVYVVAMDRAPGLHPWGVIYYLQALSAKDGEFRWHSEFGGHDATTPVVDDDTVYIESIGSGLYALDATTGQSRWFFPTDNPVSDPIMGTSDPVVDNGVVYLSIEGVNSIDPNEPRDNKLIAIEGGTGKLLWSIALEKSFQPRLAPLVTSTAVYFVNGPELYTADPQTGEKSLIFKTEQDFVTEPILKDGNIYISSYWDLIAINADSGELQWDFPIDEGFISSMLVSDNIVYISTIIDQNPHSIGRGKITAIDLKTQNELWHFDFDGPIFSLVDDNDTVYFGSGPELHGLKKATGKEVWQFEAEGMINDPVYANGMIYAGDWDGYLHAIPAAENSDTVH